MTKRPAVARLADGREGFLITEVARVDEASQYDFHRAVSMLEAGNYGGAIVLLEGVIDRSPGVTAPYVNSLQYEIHEDEVIVRGGIITKSVKHVPFRTVTNLRTSQGPFDRLFGLGTLDIQTAGMSGQTGAEEKLSGLPNFVEIYDQVAQALRRYRQAMGPTASEDEPVMNAEASLQAILQELRAIRSSLEKDEA